MITIEVKGENGIIESREFDSTPEFVQWMEKECRNWRSLTDSEFWTKVYERRYRAHSTAL
jgi:hypothetical protein